MIKNLMRAILARSIYNPNNYKLIRLGFYHNWRKVALLGAALGCRTPVPLLPVLALRPLD